MGRLTDYPLFPDGRDDQEDCTEYFLISWEPADWVKS
jgi:hypothetical protein